MLELLFLLLPIAVLYGWYVGYRKACQDYDKEESSRSQKIVSGLRFLLEDKKKKASEVLVDLLNLDSANYDANLALAEVYRSRGDFDRAIQIHEELLSSSLPKIKNDLVSYELAKDFIAVSLYIKAIELLKVPKSDNELQLKSIKLLIKTYQRLGEWDAGLSLISSNKSILTTKYTEVLFSQFICEKAQFSLASGKESDGEKLLLRALDINHNCIRAMILLSDIYNNRGENKAAIDTLNSIIDINPNMALIALPSLRKCFNLPKDNDNYMLILNKWVNKLTSSNVVIEFASLLIKTDLIAAREIIVQHLKLHPSLKLFAKLLDLQILSTNDNVAKENMGLILSLINAEVASRNIYSCHNCGFSTRIMFWKCPSCSEWETIQPINGFEGD